MRRRQVLAALGTVGVAGCLGTSPTDSGGSTSSLAPTTTDDDPSTTDAATAGSPTTTQAPPQVGRPAPVDGCPTYDDSVARVVCNDGGSPDAPLAMVPDGDPVTLPEDGISFTLANDTDATFETNFYAWRVHKRVDGDWYHVAPMFWNQPLTPLPSGESHTWTVTVDNADLDRPLPTAEDTESVAVPGLGGGEYAFGTDGWFRTHERKTAAVARFRVEGDQVDLVPTESVTVEGVEGDTLVASERVHGEDGDPARLVATRVEDPDGEVTETVTEQLLRWTHRRNAVALFRDRDVRQVRVEGYTPTTPAYGVDGPEFLRYDGTTYRIESERRSG